LSNLLARFAENAFWMARYMERAENLARTLDVNSVYAREAAADDDWRAIVFLNADEQRFFARHQRANAEAVIQFYVLDDDNPSAIRSAVRAARENARSLRHLISTEAWRQINVFHDRLTALGPADVATANLATLCDSIKEACQTHAGIVDGTLLHDEAWLFYNLGKYIERADQTTRLLDIKFHLLHTPVGAAEPYLATSQWDTLLRSVAGYHAFVRIHPRGIRARDVAAFLLTNLDFPRSVALCVATVDGLIRDLQHQYDLKLDRRIVRILADLTTSLDDRNVDQIVPTGVHDFIDGIQHRLGRLTVELESAFFGQEQDDSG
jgi:uncharacterized alpha-E superfamily protein